MTVMFDRRRLDPRCVTGVTLDTRATTSATPAGPVTGVHNSSRPRLACQWHHNAQGRLACTWRQVSANELGEPHRGRSDISLPPVQPPSAALTTGQCMVLASILAVAGLETVIWAWIGGGAPF